MPSLNKKQIENAFDKGATNYDWAALIQRETAEKLMSFTPDTAPKNILEIGCGTGFLTKLLVQKYPESQITATDISGKMIEKCKSKIPFIHFEKTDGETFESTEKYDLIISNMTVQWFENPVMGIDRLKEFLNPNGNLLFSTLGSKSFHQWRGILKHINLSDGILVTPDYKYLIHEEEEQAIYQKGIDFIKNLKDIGAHKSDAKPLSPAQLKQACAMLESKYYGGITWHILYGHHKA